MASDEDILNLRARIRYLEQQVATLTSSPRRADSGESDVQDSEDIGFVYPSLEAWITEEYVPIYIKVLDEDLRWCKRWWAHVEAVSRFEALWRAWERLRLDPAFGIAVWYRDYFDLTLPMITGPKGPFAHCSPEHHEDLEPLPVEPAPAGYWDWPEEESLANPDSA